MKWACQQEHENDFKETLKERTAFRHHVNGNDYVAGLQALAFKLAT